MALPCARERATETLREGTASETINTGVPSEERFPPPYRGLAMAKLGNDHPAFGSQIAPKWTRSDKARIVAQLFGGTGRNQGPANRTMGCWFTTTLRVFDGVKLLPGQEPDHRALFPASSLPSAIARRSYAWHLHLLVRCARDRVGLASLLRAAARTLLGRFVPER